MAVLAGIAAGAHAQAYPTKAIRLIVPYTPGGTSDILARVIGQKMNEAWGRPVIVENKPGANGNIGADLVAKAAPDGYTLLLADIGALCISPSVLAGLPFDPAKDFAAGGHDQLLPARPRGASGAAREQRQGADRPGQGQARHASTSRCRG